MESVGLWQGRRWGEYLATVATSIFLPWEVYELACKNPTWLKAAALVINLLLVIYLMWTKWMTRGPSLVLQRTVVARQADLSQLSHRLSGRVPD